MTTVHTLAATYLEHSAGNDTDIIAFTNKFDSLQFVNLDKAASIVGRLIPNAGNGGQSLMRYLNAHKKAGQLQEYVERLGTVIHWSLIDAATQAAKIIAKGDQNPHSHIEDVNAFLDVLGSETTLTVDTFGEWYVQLGPDEGLRKLIALRVGWVKYRRYISTMPAMGEVHETTRSPVQIELMGWFQLTMDAQDLEAYIEVLKEDAQFKYPSRHHNPLVGLQHWVNEVHAVLFTRSLIRWWMLKHDLVLPF